MQSSDTGIIIAALSFLASVVLALLTWIRFRRKDRADTQAVESGTISGRFKDADSLVRYINERVDAETKDLREELAKVRSEFDAFKKDSQEVHGAVRTNYYQQWIWDRSGRPGPLPQRAEPILALLGIADPLAVTHPSLKEQS